MTVLITGANQGIGYYMVLDLLRQGAKIAVLDIEVSALATLQKEYEDQLLLLQCDVCEDEEVRRAVAQGVETFGDIDIAIHNACYCTFESLGNTPLETYRQVMEVNYFGALRLAKNMVPYMQKAKKGKVIFTSSGVGVTGFFNISPYAASKDAIESLAKSLRQEFKDTNITFHLFHPPLTQTKSAEPLPVPKEMKASAEVVGVGLAKRINKKSFIICHSGGQQFQMRLSYLFPLKLGGLMTMMTKRVEKQK